jgi:hypothetical protein
MHVAMAMILGKWLSSKSFMPIRPYAVRFGDKVTILANQNLRKKDKKALKKKFLEKHPDFDGKIFVMGIKEYIHHITNVRVGKETFKIEYVGAYNVGSLTLGDGIVSRPTGDVILTFKLIMGESGPNVSVLVEEGVPDFVSDAIMQRIMDILDMFNYPLVLSFPARTLALDWEIEMLPEHFYRYLNEALPEYDMVHFLWYPQGPLVIYLFGGPYRVQERHLAFLRSEMKHWDIKDYRIEHLNSIPGGIIKEVYYPKYGVSNVFLWELEELL